MSLFSLTEAFTKATILRDKSPEFEEVPGPPPGYRLTALVSVPTAKGAQKFNAEIECTNFKFAFALLEALKEGSEMNLVLQGIRITRNTRQLNVRAWVDSFHVNATLRG